jgi:hypothetical protein
MTYIDRRVYVMTLDKEVNYSPRMTVRPPNICQFNPICREMVEEFDLGDYSSCETDVIEFFATTNCGCEHEISPGDAFLMPEGTIFLTVMDEDIKDRTLFGCHECSWDENLAFIEYRCHPSEVINWVSKCYPKIIGKRA